MVAIIRLRLQYLLFPADDRLKAFLIVVREKRNPEKSGQDGMFLRKFWISKLDLFCLNLTWHWPFHRPNLKWASQSNSASQVTHKTWVAQHSCSIFIWWPYLTWPWPRPLLIGWLVLQLWSKNIDFRPFSDAFLDAAYEFRNTNYKFEENLRARGVWIFCHRSCFEHFTLAHRNFFIYDAKQARAG